MAAAGLSLVGAAAPAAAQAADGPSVDTAVASVVDIVKATGEVVKQGVSAAQTGAEYAKAAYEQASGAPSLAGRPAGRCSASGWAVRGQQLACPPARAPLPAQSPPSCWQWIWCFHRWNMGGALHPLCCMLPDCRCRGPPPLAPSSGRPGGQVCR